MKFLVFLLLSGSIVFAQEFSFIEEDINNYFNMRMEVSVSEHSASESSDAATILFIDKEAQSWSAVRYRLSTLLAYIQYKGAIDFSNYANIRYAWSQQDFIMTEEWLVEYFNGNSVLRSQKLNNLIGAYEFSNQLNQKFLLPPNADDLENIQIEQELLRNDLPQLPQF